jgi:arsenate reductase
MDPQITVYEKPTCSKCRELNKLLTDNGIDYTKVNYYIEPIGSEKLRELLAKMQIKPRDLLRKSEQTYRDLGLADSSHTDAEIIELMAEHLELIQRPIVERGDRAVLGRPVENVKSLISEIP